MAHGIYHRLKQEYKTAHTRWLNRVPCRWKHSVPALSNIVAPGHVTGKHLKSLASGTEELNYEF